MSRKTELERKEPLKELLRGTWPPRPTDSSLALDRRELIGGSALAAAVALAGCRPDTDAPPPIVEEGEPVAAPPEFELEEVTFEGLREGMESGKWSSRGITELYLQRIDQLDSRGPELRSVIETNPDALEIADALDRERQEKGARGPLHGIPILLKDNIATADRTQTTAGSTALEGSAPVQDSFVARRLRESGAVLLGKTNLSEWANFRSEMSSSGWSARGGLCRNPYALDRTACGSSSGSGVATSGNLVAAAIGTETNGSIVCPASANGLVGIKPTVGLVSRSAIIPISHSQDTAGPMARTVRDAALLLGALVGGDPADSATAASAGHLHGDYTQFLDPAGLEGARIGVVRRFFGFHPEVDQRMEEALAALEGQGAVVVDKVELPRFEPGETASYDVLLYEFKAGIRAYLASLGPDFPIRSLADLISYNEQHRATEMPFFGQEIFHKAEAKGPLTSPEYRRALERVQRLTRAEGIDKAIADHRLDALVGPTGGPAWLIDLVNGDHFGGGSSSPAAIAGYPNITVPAGFVAGLPVGISFFGPAWSEPALLRIAYAFEQATRHRRPPRFLPSVELRAKAEL